MSVFGVDYAWGRPGVPALKRAGVKFACRYLSHDTTGKNLDREEARQLSDGGIWIVVIWETTAGRALAGRAAGVADATAAEKQAKALGQPAGRPIFFAVDFDAAPGQQDEIHAYLDGAASVLGRDRIGLYAGYGPIKRAFDAKKIAYGWQTYGWSGGRWDTRALLQQYSNDQKINGVGLDYDRALGADYGQWRIGVTPAEDETLKIVINLGSSKAVTVEPGKRVSIKFDKEYSDPQGIHKDGSYPDWLPETSAFHVATLTLIAEGIADGEKLKMIISEYERDSSTRIRDLIGEDKVGNGTRIEYTLSGIVWFSEKNKYRADVNNYGTVPIKIVSAALKVAR
ncbi:MAG: glycoside hydrolase domain-containing protein [Streptosporangiaceae bacterium]